MTDAAFVLHLAFGAGLLLLSILVVRFMLQRAPVMDIPNDRSSHASPTPKSGGVAIVVTFLAGIAGIYLFGENAAIATGYFWGFVFSALLIAAISFYDDIKNKPFAVRLVAQCIAAAIVLWSGIVIDELALPFVGTLKLGWLGYPFTFLWIVGLTNAFNFMDGLDGLAAGVALIAAAFFCWISFSQGSTLAYLVCYGLIAGTAGFLFYNFPPARIFMGDVGSAFLGFTFAVLAVIAARYDHSHTSFLVMPLLLFHFIYDTAFTFFRRLLRGERVVEAHRSHLYQLFSRLGYSHRTVSLFYWGLTVIQGVAAVWLVKVPGEARLLLFSLPLLLMAAFSLVVLIAAKKAGLLARKPVLAPQ